MVHSVRVIGAGRAGSSLAGALDAAGWPVDGPLRRSEDVTDAAAGVELLAVATPDATVAGVAAAVRPVDTTVVCHLAGSLGLDVLAPHARRASLHPLVALPGAALGAERLRGAWFAVWGDALVDDIVAALGGQALRVPDQHRVVYHAAAVIASNHLVGLLGQVERVAATVGVPLEVYLDLVRGTVDNVAALGPAAALTGPVARGDWETVARHVAAIDEGERSGYEAMAELCRRLMP